MTFLKWLLSGILQLFCLHCDKIFLICVWESIRFPKQLSSRTPLNSCPLYNLIQSFVQSKILLYARDVFKTQSNIQELVSENSCSKNFINFQDKHPGEIAFLNKVAGYLTLARKVLLRNLWNFQNRFDKKLPRMPASAISCHWKIFRPNNIF